MARWISTDWTQALSAQRGDALIEALIAILVMAAVGMGLAYAAGRAVNTQAQSNAHYLLVAGVRDYLQQINACDVGSMTVCLGKDWTECNDCASKGQDVCPHVVVTLNCVAATIDVNGTSTQLNRLASITTTPDDSAASVLFGGDGYVVISLD
jgi:Tfp pilus assembly protein PilV